MTVRALAIKYKLDPKTVRGYLDYLKIPYNGKPLSIDDSSIPNFESFLNISKGERKRLLCNATCINKFGTPYHNNLEKAKQTAKERYGDENYRNVKQSKQTKKEKYGDESYTNREKAKQTCIKKYGFTTASQSDEIKQKCEKHFIEKYGDNPARVFKDKIKEAKISSFNEEQKSLEKEYGPLYSVSQLKDMLGHCETSVLGILNYSQSLYDVQIIKGKQSYIKQTDLKKVLDIQKVSGGSRFEEQVGSFIESLGFNICKRVKTIITPKELDIYIPEKKIAIECNGIYWHSDLPFEGIEKDAQFRHLEKTIACGEKGIRLIHVFEDDWIYKRDIIESILSIALGKPLFKVFARKCIIKELSLKDYKEFLIENHLQGFSFANIRLGLFFNDMLIECIGVNEKGTHSKEPELVRLCTKKQYQVLGGFSKLLKATKVGYLTSYIDKATFSGNGYSQSGFKIVKENPPTFFWTKGNQRIPRYKFMKKIIKQKYEKGELRYYNEKEPEWVNMKKNGYGRIWNCGTIKVEYRKEEL